MMKLCETLKEPQYGQREIFAPHRSFLEVYFRKEWHRQPVILAPRVGSARFYPKTWSALPQGWEQCKGPYEPVKPDEPFSSSVAQTMTYGYEDEYLHFNLSRPPHRPITFDSDSNDDSDTQSDDSDSDESDDVSSL